MLILRESLLTRTDGLWIVPPIEISALFQPGLSWVSNIVNSAGSVRNISSDIEIRIKHVMPPLCPTAMSPESSTSSAAACSPLTPQDSS